MSLGKIMDSVCLNDPPMCRCWGWQSRVTALPTLPEPPGAEGSAHLEAGNEAGNEAGEALAWPRGGGSGQRGALRGGGHRLSTQGQARRGKRKADAVQTRACAGISGGGRFSQWWAVKTRAQFLSGCVAEWNSCLGFSWCKNMAVKCDRNLGWGCSALRVESCWVLCWLRCLLYLRLSSPAEGKLTVPGGICAFTICPFQKRKRNYINLF